MANISNQRRVSRDRRRNRVRKRIVGTNERPRLCVFRSLRYTYAQLISDEDAGVICSASSKMLATKDVTPGSRSGAKEVGKKIAELAKEKNVSSVVFDRNGYVYHGRVAAVAEGARENGLQF